MKTVVAALCVLTLLAVAYLSLSLIVLRPPRANDPTWFTLATIIAVQSVGTFMAMANSRARLRSVVAGGGAALATIGLWMLRTTLASPHFEGYALVLGAMLLAQGLLTGAMFVRTRLARGLIG